MESIDRERAQRIKEGRTESTRSTDSAKENVKYATGDSGKRYNYGKKFADHYLGETALKALPQSLSKPVAVIKSNSVPGRIIGIHNVKVNGKQMVAAIEIDGLGRQNNKRIDSNTVTSFYGKGNAIKMLNIALHRLTRAHSPLSCAMDK